jgi:hypothetical protein
LTQECLDDIYTNTTEKALPSTARDVLCLYPVRGKAPRNPSRRDGIDFESVYFEAIKPAVELAGYEC